MKKTHIIALLMMVVAIVIFLTASTDISTYATFEKAKTAESKVKVNGVLDLEYDIEYDPAENPNYFSFNMLDTDNQTNKVIMTSAMPQDFERSEQVVVTGTMKEGVFVATEILTKCPSKYKNEEIYIRSDS